MENGNVAGSGRTALIRNAARGGKWLIPVAALAAIALSLLRLSVTPEGWQSERVCAAVEGLGRLVPDPVACIALASLMLIYWGARERGEAAALAGLLGRLADRSPRHDCTGPRGRERSSLYVRNHQA